MNSRGSARPAGWRRRRPSSGCFAKCDGSESGAGTERSQDRLKFRSCREPRRPWANPEIPRVQDGSSTLDHSRQSMTTGALPTFLGLTLDVSLYRVMLSACREKYATGSADLWSMTCSLRSVCQRSSAKPSRGWRPWIDAPSPTTSDYSWKTMFTAPENENDPVRGRECRASPVTEVLSSCAADRLQKGGDPWHGSTWIRAPARAAPSDRG